MITTDDFNYTINTFGIHCCLIPLVLAFPLINEPGNLHCGILSHFNRITGRQRVDYSLIKDPTVQYMAVVPKPTCYLFCSIRTRMDGCLADFSFCCCFVLYVVFLPSATMFSKTCSVSEFHLTPHTVFFKIYSMPLASSTHPNNKHLQLI